MDAAPDDAPVPRAAQASEQDLPLGRVGVIGRGSRPPLLRRLRELAVSLSREFFVACNRGPNLLALVNLV